MEQRHAARAGTVDAASARLNATATNFERVTTLSSIRKGKWQRSIITRREPGDPRKFSERLDGSLDELNRVTGRQGSVTVTACPVASASLSPANSYPALQAWPCHVLHPTMDDRLRSPCPCPLSMSSSGGALATIALYCAGLIDGSFCRNATRLQIVASSWLAPHAGMALILMPCLITQNATCGSICTLVRSGG